jgi:pimeloyl-ACP methyl ester carboxylesterase
MMTYIPIKVDVTSALPRAVTAGATIEVAAWIFAPAEGRAPAVPSTIALLNGGTYDKRYFHVEVPGRTGYSAAEALAERGHLVILLDHLGIGESTRAPDQMKVTRHVAASANHAALQTIYARLEAGALDRSLPAMPHFLKVGGGHSMGGFQTITQQAQHRTYDRVMVLGYTAIGVHLTRGGVLFSADPGPLDQGQPDYRQIDRAAIRETFHWDDVPDDVLAVDDALQVDVPYVLSTQSVTRGIVTEDAARIDVPVYICLGERDVSPDPHAEPGFYRSSPDVTLHVLPRSGHCQSFASTRMAMIDRIDGWIRGIDAAPIRTEP